MFVPSEEEGSVSLQLSWQTCVGLAAKGSHAVGTCSLACACGRMKWCVGAQNYRCVVVLGKARPITDPKEKAAALLKLTEHIIPGRTQHAREASDRELSQTSVLAIDLNEVSAKVDHLPQHTWSLFAVLVS